MNVERETLQINCALETSELRRRKLEQAIRSLETIHDVAIAIGDGIALERALELIVERGSALVHSSSLAIMLHESGDLVWRASAGYLQELGDARLSVAESIYGQVFTRQRPQRVVEAGSRLGIAPREAGIPEVHSALLVPMCHRGEAVGLLVGFDPRDSGHLFSEDDERTLRTLAASAATAVILARRSQTEQPRCASPVAADERRRWARELHEDALQALGSLRLVLCQALRTHDLHIAQAGIRAAVAQVEQETENLRALDAELRASASDELGLSTAIERRSNATQRSTS